nr:MAG TPA: hypothetical protein [Caudoviricetes sp.]
MLSILYANHTYLSILFFLPSMRPSPAEDQEEPH